VAPTRRSAAGSNRTADAGPLCGTVHFHGADNGVGVTVICTAIRPSGCRTAGVLARFFTPGRTHPDAALRAYLMVIARAPDAVKAALMAE
jgi:hypothetical protein